jgi:hypothetical protein
MKKIVFKIVFLVNCVPTVFEAQSENIKISNPDNVNEEVFDENEHQHNNQEDGFNNKNKKYDRSDVVERIRNNASKLSQRRKQFCPFISDFSTNQIVECDIQVAPSKNDQTVIRLCLNKKINPSHVRPTKDDLPKMLIYEDEHLKCYVEIDQKFVNVFYKMSAAQGDEFSKSDFLLNCSWSKSIDYNVDLKSFKMFADNDKGIITLYLDNVL